METLAFVLLATVFANGEAHVYEIDHNLTGQDCIARMVEVRETGTAQFGLMEGAVLSCEFDVKG